MLPDRFHSPLRRAAPRLVFGSALLFFACCFLWPIAVTAREAFTVDGRPSFEILAEVLRYPLYREGLVNAAWIGLCSTVGAVLLATPLAVCSSRYRFPAHDLLGALLLIPLILPPFVGALGIKQLLGQAGALNSLLIRLDWLDPSRPVDWLGEHRLLGVVLMNTLHLFPILYLNLVASLAAVDPAMEEAAQSLGCPPWKRFFRITLPLAAPGLFAGCTLVFIWAFTELGVPLVFDYTRVTPVQIFDGLSDLAGNPYPFALVILVLAATALLFALTRILIGRREVTLQARPGHGRQARQLPPAAAWGVSLLFAAVAAVGILPHASVVLLAVSTDWYQTVLPQHPTLAHFAEALGHPLTLSSIRNSLVYAGGATALDLVLGIGIAYVVVRSSLPGRRILDALSMLPLAVPGLVLAFGFLAMTREGQPLAWLVPGGDPLFILVLAYAIRRLPYVTRSAVAGFEQTSPVLEEAAGNLGAAPLTVLRRITLPLISAHLLAGGLLAFSFAMLEVSDSLVLATRRQDFPITKAIYSLLDSLGNGHLLASALGTWAMAFLAVTLLGAGLLLGRRLGSIFRV